MMFERPESDDLREVFSPQNASINETSVNQDTLSSNNSEKFDTKFKIMI